MESVKKKLRQEKRKFRHLVAKVDSLKADLESRQFQKRGKRAMLLFEYRKHLIHLRVGGIWTQCFDFLGEKPLLKHSTFMFRKHWFLSGKIIAPPFQLENIF